MKSNTSFPTISALIAALCALTACATTAEQHGSEDSEISKPQVISHTVAPGDQLGEIASRYTGKISLWREIAEFNNIEDPRALRAGDIVDIPHSLMPTKQVLNGARESQESAKSKGSLIAASNTLGSHTGTTTAAPLGLKRDSSAKTIESDIIVNAVQINRTFELSPLDRSNVISERSNDVHMPHVKVIGTYFPKGIYQQPASYSTLLSRVAPGTVFVLEREINDWYKIITENGIGYLRAIDGRIIID